MLAALPALQAAVGPVRVAFAGPYEGVLGERYYEQLGPLIERHRDQLTFLGELHGTDLANFYAAIDCLALPSVNSTESFGLVQVEADAVRHAGGRVEPAGSAAAGHGHGDGRDRADRRSRGSGVGAGQGTRGPGALRPPSGRDRRTLRPKRDSQPSTNIFTTACAGSYGTQQCLG